MARGKRGALLVAVAALLLLANPITFIEPAEASTHPVHPGDQMSNGSASCTINFAFDGVGPQAGNVYFGTAAHCVSSVGQSITVAGSSGFATVAYIHPGSDLADDFAFLRVAPENEHRVRADVRGHSGTPTGVKNAPSSIGDLLLYSGHGVGFNLHSLTRESRVGVVWSHGPDAYRAEAPIIFGDSGGPVVHASTGGAFGINSALVVGCCQGPGYWVEGPTVQGMIANAADNGFHVQLRTA